MASEPTKWEPSAASIENMLRATAEVQGYNFDEIPLGEIEEARCVAPVAIKAAVAADPLLSAAADMRDALECCQNILSDLARPPENYASISTAAVWAQCVAAEKLARDVLAKAKGGL